MRGGALYGVLFHLEEQSRAKARCCLLFGGSDVAPF